MSYVPPTFGEIGKATKDLLNKDFPVGFTRLEVNTSSPNDVKFTVLGAKDNNSGKINSELKIKYSDKPLGATFTGAWTTADVLAADVQFKNTVAKGLTLGLAGSLHTPNGAKTSTLNFELRKDYVSFRSTVDILRGPTVQGDVVFGSSHGYVFGGETAFDVSKNSVTKYNIGLAQIRPDYSVSLHVTNLKRVTGSYFHRAATNIEAGGQVVWEKDSDKLSHLEFGAKAAIDPFTTFKAKINTKGLVGLSYVQVLRPGVKVNAGASLDSTNLSSESNKLGLAITIES